ncbi:hypothetical protein [Cytophaga hutchinsonii]|uniref:Uncharacterized protein n=1 Tax=Cytophaga hutchinsonii (strain ATCC 33406 / DSM 1761 / CIP 103989 / NBRC 15051 / NCIMB 9469 / D465) TaxID=269798 RepID=A0A6N4SS28_CYTH3|nr:hypothetical protein [Cytophaga hutchinsonii]ABG59219.1 hypothetical protein CHU_1953 [Cytophaga hutchinsonii ATCC 33406]SFX34041.1 hypothetical protein SAMN04487930_10387 [Cytophaga hutchinsonii ATCC 33406]
MEIFNLIDASYLFLIMLFPITGFYLFRVFDIKTIKKIVVISLLLLVSRLSGYIIITNWLYVVCAFCILSVVYAYAIKLLEYFYRKTISVILVILLLCFSLVYSFFNAFGGVLEKPIASDRLGRYKVETVMVSGFSGTGAATHKLYYYPIWFLVYKNVETIRIDPFKESKECIVSFKRYEIDYNSCLNEIE